MNEINRSGSTTLVHVDLHYSLVLSQLQNVVTGSSLQAKLEPYLITRVTECESTNHVDVILYPMILDLGR